MSVKGGFANHSNGYIRKQESAGRPKQVRRHARVTRVGLCLSPSLSHDVDCVLLISCEEEEEEEEAASGGIVLLESAPPAAADEGLPLDLFRFPLGWVRGLDGDDDDDAEVEEGAVDDSDASSSIESSVGSAAPTLSDVDAPSSRMVGVSTLLRIQSPVSGEQANQSRRTARVRIEDCDGRLD